MSRRARRAVRPRAGVLYAWLLPRSGGAEADQLEQWAEVHAMRLARLLRRHVQDLALVLGRVVALASVTALLASGGVLAQTPGSRDTSFATGTGVIGEVTASVLQPDGRSILFGGFGVFNGMQVGRAVRLNVDGSRDSSLSTPITGVIRSAVLQLNGRIVVGGSFSAQGGNGVARLLSDGQIDTSFAVGVGTNNGVPALAVDGSGRVLAGGVFTTFSGVPCGRIVRLSANGTLDTGFAPQGGANGSVKTMEVQPDGKILVGGTFTAFGGVPCSRLVRLLDSGQVDPGFSTGTGFDLAVNDVVLQPDGRIIVAGAFSTVAGVSQPAIVRLQSNGALDPTFAANATPGSVLYSVALLPSGRILIGGGGTFGGAPCPGLGMLSSSGLPASGFNVGSGINGAVAAIVPVSDSQAIVAGDFSSFNGQNCGGILRVWTSYACFADGDGDGYGSGAAFYGTTPCGPGFVLAAGDCDDTRANVFPGAVEICDGLDNDCDGVIDDGITFTYFPDSDGDGWGSAAGGLLTCNPPGGYVLTTGDCDDTRPSVYPGASEICDGLDNDCNGSIDPGFITTYCTAGTTVLGCVPSISGQGAPSSSSPSGFDIVVSNVPAQRYGLIFYGSWSIPQPQPWGLGSSSYLCIYLPTARTGVQDTGGVAGTCSGELRVDFNQFMANNPAATGSPFHAGQVLHAQGWFRDPGAAKQTNLSNALTFTLCN